MKSREDKRMIKLDLLINCLFWTYSINKNRRIPFLVHGHSSLSTFNLHLVRGPKTLLIDSLINQTMEVGL